MEAVAAARSGTMKVRPSNPRSSFSTVGSASITLKAWYSTGSGGTLGGGAGNWVASGASAPPKSSWCDSGHWIWRAATLARPFLVVLKSARMAWADSGFSVSTNWRLWPSAFSMATTNRSGTRMRSASEPITARDWRKAATAPAL